jgi:hypothetical protein
MSAIILAANSTTLIINGTVISDLVEGDTVSLAPVNPATSHNNAIGGGVTINERTDKAVYDLTVNVHMLSASDAYLTGIINQAAPVVLNGSAKQSYTRDGEQFEESYSLESGSITTQPTKTTNSTDGNNTMTYVMRFRTVTRTI